MPTAVVGDFGMGLPSFAQVHKDVSDTLPGWVQPLALDHHICADQSQSLLFASPNDEHPENFL